MSFKAHPLLFESATTPRPKSDIGSQFASQELSVDVAVPPTMGQSYDPVFVPKPDAHFKEHDVPPAMDAPATHPFTVPTCMYVYF